MKMNNSFSHRPFSILALSLVLSCAVFAPAHSQEATVRYGSGGFAPTDLTSPAPMSGNVTGSAITSSPLEPSSNNSYQANLEIRLSELENQMRTLRGQMEEKDHQIIQLKDRLEKAVSDLEMRVGGQPGSAVSAAPSSPAPLTGAATDAMPPQPGETAAAGSLSDIDMSANPNAPAPANAPTQQNLGTLNEAPGGGSIAPASGDVAAQYEAAYAKLKAGDYAAAQIEFDRFLKTNPTHQLSSNAIYWYGETFYAQQKFTEASRIFAESYKKYPKGPKAADSLLKLGMSLGGSGKTKEACVSLKQLKKQYASGNSTLLKRADQEMTKLACE